MAVALLIPSCEALAEHELLDLVSRVHQPASWYLLASSAGTVRIVSQHPSLRADGRIIVFSHQEKLHSRYGKRPWLPRGARPAGHRRDPRRAHVRAGRPV